MQVFTEKWRLQKLLIICFIFLTSVMLFAQEPEVDSVAGKNTFEPKTYFGIDAGILQGSIHLIPNVARNVYLGIGIGYSWEEDNVYSTFSKNIWNAFHIDLYGRYQPWPFLHADLGISYLSFNPHDDDTRSGSFFGGYTSVGIGYRYVFLAANMRFGRAKDYQGSEFGITISPLLRFTIPL